MRHAIIAWERTSTNVALARAADWLLLNPVRALKVLRPGTLRSRDSTSAGRSTGSRWAWKRSASSLRAESRS